MLLLSLVGVLISDAVLPIAVDVGKSAVHSLVQKEDL